MIDRTHDLPVVRQCQLLELARSTAYYRPQPTSVSDFCIDALEEAIARYGPPDIVNTDQGSQFNRKAIDVAIGAAVFAEAGESALLTMAELDAAIATVTTQYVRLAPLNDIAAEAGEVLVAAPAAWS